MEQTKNVSLWRKLVACLASLALALALVPAVALTQASTAWADDTYSWSGSGSTSASSGVLTIEGDGTLTLSADTTATVYVKSGTVTIDLASYTLTQGSESSSAAPYKATVYVEIGATLTIKGESGTVENSTTGSGSAAVFNNGTCTIESGTYKVTSSDGKAWYTIANHGTMTINGGTFTNSGAVSSSGSSLVENGYQSPDSGNALTGYVEGTNAQYPSLTITAGTFTASSTIAVKNDECGVLSISGGTFSASNQSVQNWSEATISGGTFNQIVATWTYTGVATSDGVDNPTTTITGGTFNSYIYVADQSKAGNTTTVTVSGSDTSAYGIYVASSATDSADVTVYGGTFSTDVTNYLDESATITSSTTTDADGNSVTTYTVKATYVAKVATTTTTTDDDGNETTATSVTYYTTLAAAISAAISGDTVTLLQDVEESVTVESSKSLTLDLDGFTLSSSSGHVISNYGTLTITDSGEKGAVTSSGTSGSYAALANYPGATCTIKGGSFSGSSWYVIKNLGTLTIDDCTLVQNASSTSGIDNGWYGSTGNDLGLSASSYTDPKATLTINGGDFSGGLNTVKNDDYGVLVINGGTFSNTTGAVILNWNEATINGGTFTGNASDYAVVANGSCSSTSDVGALTITGGTFTASDGGTGALFGVCEGAYTGTSSTAKITVTGGTFTGSLDTAVTNVANAVYTVSVSGGSFSEAVDSSLCAEEYSPTTACVSVTTTDADGTETTATYYTVAAGTISFWGGSLRIDKYMTATEGEDGTTTYTYGTSNADLRLGFCWDDLPEGATVTSFGWAWGTSESAVEAATTTNVTGTNQRPADSSVWPYDQGSSGTVANLVVTGIPAASFDTGVYAKMFVTYTVTTKGEDGSTTTATYTITSDTVGRDVYYIASAAKTSITAIAEASRTEAQAIELAYATKVLGDSGSCSHTYAAIDTADDDADESEEE